MKTPCSLAVPKPLIRAFVLSALSASIALSGEFAQAQTSFYRAPQGEQIGAPGTLIRSEPMHWGVPEGAHAWRILYSSTGVKGEPIVVSGMVVAPDGAASPQGRPVVAWAHPTSGVVPRCAPSLAMSAMQSIQGLKDLLARGEVVVATDYPGLGTQGPHPYLVGSSAGAAILDSARAARQLADAHAGSRFAAWGHSQGGQAVLYTALMAARYAPELQLVGVAAAAPATDLETLMRDDFDSTGGRNLTAMTLWSWSRVFGAPIGPVVAPAAMPTVDALAGECIESVFDVLHREHTGKSLAQTFLTVPDITRVEPWRTLMRDNTPGPLPPAVPVMLVQGDADTLVRPAVTAGYMSKRCAAGSKVKMLTMPGDGHGFVARDAAPQAVHWMAERFADQPAPDDCSAASVAANP
jgi:pimeloyl-ACP methyl ester carboxylesterase